MNLASITGLIVGIGYGYIAQRGAFCMNSGFRVVVTERNTTKVKAYALAIALQMLLVPLVFALGVSSPTYPAMFPVGAILGGMLFGASLEVASEYTGRLTVMLVIFLAMLWLTWWVIRSLYEPLATRSARWCSISPTAIRSAP